MNRGSLTRANYGYPWFPSQKLTSDHDEMCKETLSVQDNQVEFCTHWYGLTYEECKDTSTSEDFDKYFSREIETPRGVLPL